MSMDRERIRHLPVPLPKTSVIAQLPRMAEAAATTLLAFGLAGGARGNTVAVIAYLFNLAAVNAQLSQSAANCRLPVRM